MVSEECSVFNQNLTNHINLEYKSSLTQMNKSLWSLFIWVIFYNPYLCKCLKILPAIHLSIHRSVRYMASSILGPVMVVLTTSSRAIIISAPILFCEKFRGVNEALKCSNPRGKNEALIGYFIILYTWWTVTKIWTYICILLTIYNIIWA